MEPFEYKITSWTLNQVYNRIVNCKVVNTPYEESYYSNDFFLDKRLWLEPLYTWAWKKFLDKATIQWNEYYLYQEAWKSYIWVLSWSNLINVTPNWFTISSNSPMRLTYGKWLYWSKDWNVRTVTSPVLWMWDEAWSLIPWYAWWYVKFTYTWTQNIQVWDLILFNTWALAWWINRVEKIDNGNIYIIWTNARWTIPSIWTEFYVYKTVANWWNTVYWPTLLIWHTTWVSLIVLNWLSQANVINVLTTNWEEIIDLVNFDWNIFALTSVRMYYSRSTFDDNTQFYPLDYYFIDWWYKLFPIGKALLCFGRTNKLFAAANWTTSNVWYVGYDVNYNWDLYSKYSCIFADQTIYILQKDKQLKKVNISQSNTVSFDLVVDEAIPMSKWIFNSIEWWEVFMNNEQRYLNILFVKNWNTINFQYDKMYNHFIELEYTKELYLFSNRLLSNWYIFIEQWYTDMWVEYKQEINFLIDTQYFIYKPYILRTLFWLIDSKLDVELYIVWELWWKLIKDYKRLNNFVFDNRLNTTTTLDPLIDQDTSIYTNEYDWNIAMIQSRLLKQWRYIKIKYISNNRYVIWSSYVIADKHKTYINEPLLTN